jgi:hypothetical protein
MAELKTVPSTYIGLKFAYKQATIFPIELVNVNIQDSSLTTTSYRTPRLQIFNRTHATLTITANKLDQQTTIGDILTNFPSLMDFHSYRYPS